MKHHHVRDRRRSIHFDGRTITLKIAIRWGLVGSDKPCRFPARKLTDLTHREATRREHGEIVFVAPNLSTEVVSNVPSGVDPLPGNVFHYEYRNLAKVRAFLEAVDRARR
ncbi:hypothetical protein [Amycolatopsis sp.]|uniref:hypothetical protein n=1 Tax=Amycolatopsis sp. TaxID=37632 RepID=UPI002D7FCD79|nr:hypothetical protein [Amycolatopsis sp.]HET6706461.1 hypothetical protein [Amycolatopsis sp.]